MSKIVLKLQERVNRLSGELSIARQQLQSKLTRENIIKTQLRKAESLVGFYYEFPGYYYHIHTPKVTRDGVLLSIENIRLSMPTQTHPIFQISSSKNMDYFENVARDIEGSKPILETRFRTIQKFLADCQNSCKDIIGS